MTALRVKFTQQREKMLEMELWESSSLIDLLTVGVGSPLLVKFTLMEVLNIWVVLTSTGLVGRLGLLVSRSPVLVG